MTPARCRSDINPLFLPCSQWPNSLFSFSFAFCISRSQLNGHTDNTVRNVVNMRRAERRTSCSYVSRMPFIPSDISRHECSEPKPGVQRPCHQLTGQQQGKTEDGLTLGVTENQTERVRDLLIAYLTPGRKGNQGPHLKYCRQAPEQE